MKIFDKRKTLFLTAGIFIIILTLLVVVLIRIGGAYRSGLNTFSLDEQISDVTHTERQKINKITIKNLTNSGCMEVTPDGIIRVFSICEKELSEARRVTDTKYILQLYKRMTEIDLSTFQDATTVVCDGYSIIVETDIEKKAVCLKNTSGNTNPSGGNTGGSDGQGGGSADEIITIIDKVIDNIPSTPTPTLDPVVLTATPVPGNSITPTPIVIPSWGSTPTPTIAAARPFICDFTDAQGNKRPYTISNIICSTEPSPGPTLTP